MSDAVLSGGVQQFTLDGLTPGNAAVRVHYLSVKNDGPAFLPESAAFGRGDKRNRLARIPVE
ncbi:hypothetical protein OQ789_18925 [Mycobacterium sp. 94-17]|nr:hypothetical protein [Mycobacterium sp. 94-17]